MFLSHEMVHPWSKPDYATFVDRVVCPSAVSVDSSVCYTKDHVYLVTQILVLKPSATLDDDHLTA